ncbi:unnamed protein product [Onchocerca flexuosa]|uniref:Ovule protein n=1 Tax=Onchocerca flexuosa TaxID=387005 RepID=A0A183HJT5_9BILA|nr:unnamed protein product [Onchocerca flexuosa]
MSCEICACEKVVAEVTTEVTQNFHAAQNYPLLLLEPKLSIQQQQPYLLQNRQMHNPEYEHQNCSQERSAMLPGSCV